MPITIVKKSSIKRNYRILLWGASYTRKTSSIETFKDEGNIKFLSYPGEKGTDSIPEGDYIEAFVPQYEPLPDNATGKDYYDFAREKYDLILSMTRKIIRKEFGPVNVFCGDGLLKWYECILDVVGQGKYLQGKAFESTGEYTTRIYGNAHTLFANYLSELFYSDIPIIVCTSWEDYEFKDDNSSNEEKKQDQYQGRRVLYPSLPGKMAKQVVGEFNASIWCGFVHDRECNECIAWKNKGNNDKVRKGDHHIWQLNPKGEVLGVGIKGQKHRSYPTFIHQDWKTLKTLLEK